MQVVQHGGVVAIRRRVAPQVRPPFRIIGCPRSGTRYMTALLQQAGWPVQHETLDAGDEGTVSCVAALGTGEFRSTLHQVREPRATIASLVVMRRQTFWAKVGRTEDSLLERASRLWIDWNLRCERMATRTYRVEDVPHLWALLLNELGLPDRPFPTEVGRVPRDDPKPLSWSEIPHAEEIRTLAARYGYSSKELT